MIFITKHIPEENIKLNQIVINFRHFKRAIDNIWHDEMWRATKNTGIPMREIQLVEEIYRTPSKAMNVDKKITIYARHKRG